MKEFYLMRHGETRFNVHHRLQGVCDAPLTEVGIEQAKKAGQYLAKQEPIFDHWGDDNVHKKTCKIN